jgi:hypothetical protein
VDELEKLKSLDHSPFGTHQLHRATIINILPFLLSTFFKNISTSSVGSPKLRPSREQNFSAANRVI